MAEPADLLAVRRNMMKDAELLFRFAPKLAEERWPDWYRAVYPRRYASEMQDWYSPRIIGTYLCFALERMERMPAEQMPLTYKILQPILWHMIPKRMPYLFLAPHLGEAIRRTDFAGEVNWQEIGLPYEFGGLIVPRGALAHPTDGECAALFWSRTTRGAVKQPPGIKGDFTELVLRNAAFSIVALCPRSAMWFEMVRNESHPVVKVSDFFHTDDGYVPPFRTDEFTRMVNESSEATDQAFMVRCAALLLGTMLAIQARPELFESERLERTVRNKRESGMREFWTPNIVGRNYRLPEPRATQGGTHASPRLHWRRGHFRQQAYGAGRAEHKTLWIEPMLVGAQP